MDSVLLYNGLLCDITESNFFATAEADDNIISCLVLQHLIYAYMYISDCKSFHHNPTTLATIYFFYKKINKLLWIKHFFASFSWFNPWVLK